MSFVEKNYKNGETLFANDLNNLVSGIKEANAAISTKADTGNVYTKTEVTEALNLKANAADAYTKAEAAEALPLKANASDVYTKVEVNDALAEKANAADVYTKVEVDAKVASVFRYCGVVDTVADLPKDSNLVGDAYKVLEDSSVYAWNGNTWDDLGENIDLTPYLTKEEAAKQYATVDDTANIELQLETKLNSADATKFALKTELPDVSNFITASATDEKIKASETALNEKITASDVKTDEKIAASEAKTNAKIEALEAADKTFALKTELPDVSGFAKQADVDAKFTETVEAANEKFALKSAIPDVSEFITVAAVDEKITTANDAANKKFALKSELPNVSEFITGTTADEKISASEAKADEKFALKSAIPDVSGFAKQTDVDTKLIETVEAVDKKYVAKTTTIDKVGYTTVSSNGSSVSLSAVDSNKTGKQSGISLDAQSIMQMVNVKDDSISKKASLINITVDAVELKRRTDDGTMYAVEVVDLANNITKVAELDKSIAAVNASLGQKANVSVEGDMLVVNSKITELEQKILNLSKTNIVNETISAEANYNQPDADLVITGNDQAITENTDITAKSVSLNQAKAENAVLTAVASSGSISMQNFSNSGDLPKSTSNAAVKLNSNDTVIINKSNFNQTGYNSVEIGLNDTAPKNISIDGLDFTAPLSNNAILIFAHAENAVINISNCHFANVSNALRLSNRLNVPATINIVNCTVDKWDSRDKWAGFLIMEDYTSSSAEEAATVKRFANLTINFVNVKGPDGKLIKPDDVASICGTSNAATQAIYVFHDADKEVKPYSSGLYPKMTFA